MKQLLFLISMSVMAHTVTLHAQGIIVNEISQGSSGTKEFVEFLVVGSSSQPTGTVDLRDWIIDDNNGAFKLSDNTAPGIASGHGRFAPNDTMAAVPIGALIVIYNVADTNAIWNFVQVDSNGHHLVHIENNGMVYYIPGTSLLLRACMDFPNTTDTTYAYVNSTIPPSIANWNDGFGFTNNGDAIQVRQPNGAFYHGFGFSTPTQADAFTTFPTFTEVNLPSFNGHTGNAAGKVTYLDCGSWYYASSYLTGNATTSASTTTETPGLANNANNAMLIAHVQSGQLNYASLVTPNAICSVVLPIALRSFTAVANNNAVLLKWQEGEKIQGICEIEKSSDQSHWTSVYKTTLTNEEYYEAIDASPFNGLSFYRLKQTDKTGFIQYSKVVPVQMHVSTISLSVAPNPAKEVLHIAGNEAVTYTLYNNLGQKVKNGNVNVATSSISLSGLARGLYIIDVTDKNGNHQKAKFVKE